ncbi:MAG TPA: universal stress protein [Burkholderiales bacterium]|nr:universal stress protein [Burkholderiales bacterium]
MYRKILVAYDGSAASKKAFEDACRLAEQSHAELFVVSVARPPDIADDVETEAVIENSRQFHQSLLAGLQGALAAKKLKAHFHVATGHPAEQIIYEADRHDVDLIVVGDRGRSKFARLLLGSTSKQVAEHAGRPVLVVR